MKTYETGVPGSGFFMEQPFKMEKSYEFFKICLKSAPDHYCCIMSYILRSSYKTSTENPYWSPMRISWSAMAPSPIHPAQSTPAVSARRISGSSPIVCSWAYCLLRARDWPDFTCRMTIRKPPGRNPCPTTAAPGGPGATCPAVSPATQGMP